MSALTVDEMAAHVADLLEQRLRLKGGDLSDKLRRAGRRLPRNVREAGAGLARAEMMAQVPKLAMQTDMAAMVRAHHLCVTHLGGIDPGAVRRGIWLNLLASIGFSLLFVAVVVIVALRLRGLV
jgi:methyl coenzyme M reductase subunit C